MEKREPTEEHPYQGMSVAEIEQWQYLQEHGHLPDRKPYDAQGTAPRSWGNAEKTEREKKA